MTKTTRIVCLCILGAVGTLCGVSTINAPITEDNTKLITPTEPLRSAYIVADIAMPDPVYYAADLSPCLAQKNSSIIDDFC